MATIIEIIDEPVRGCGLRKPGGLYLRSEGLSAPCNRLPEPLTVCPCCGAGFAFTRGFTWIKPRAIFGAGEDFACGGNFCSACPLSNLPESAGLLWIGKEFYKKPKDFEFEASRMGVSRRIKAIPRGFELGVTWIFLAHLKAYVGKDGKAGPGVFSMFRPTTIEYIVTGEETENELNNLEQRGFRIVRLRRSVSDRLSQSQLL